MPETRLAHLHPLRWLGQRDRGFAALRRATRAAIIMPAMFALGDKVIGNPQVATFAAFGSFAMLLLVDFGGPMAERLQAQAALAVTGGVFVCLATLASQTAWLAAVAMAVVGFGVIFAGVVSSVLAGATTALLLAFILPVSLAAPASAVPDRLAGWGMAGGVALVATALLWPAPARDRLRGAAAAACRALAARLRAGVAYLLSGMDEQFALDRDHAAAQADQAVEALRSAFLATPYRPTGLSTPAQDDRAPGRRADLAEQHCHSAWAAPRRRQPRSAEGQGGRGRGSRTVPRISSTPGAGAAMSSTPR